MPEVLTSLRSRFRPESQQDIPRHPSCTGVARVDIDHSIDSYGAWPIDRSTVSSGPVNRNEIAGGIQVPKDLAIVGGIRAQMTINGTGKNSSGNGGHNRRLSRTATV